MRFVKQKGTSTLGALTKQALAFEQFGYDTMKRTRDSAAAEHICALALHAYNDGLQPTAADLIFGIEQGKKRIEALVNHFYERDEPASDARMFAHAIKTKVTGVLTVADILASAAAHIGTLSMMGWTVLAGIGGPVLTGFAIVAGYLAFDWLLSNSKILQTIVICLAAALAFWGLTEWAQARATVMTHIERAPASNTTYVDGAENTAIDQPPNNDEQEANQKRKSAWIKLLLSADLLLGILFGHYMRLRTDEDYLAWSKLKSLYKEVRDMQLCLNHLRSLFEIAKKKCMAGILSALYTPKKKHVPYFRSLPLLLFAAALMVPPGWSQDVKRQEGILIDISGSIGNGRANNDLFRDYLRGVRQLLATEPAGSRVIVSAITTDSFGSVRELLKGWTPQARGVFTSDLNRARRQLASSFMSKSATLTPIAAGTDIIGGLWHLKALMESGTETSSVQREIWILSDMMNDTMRLPMPGMLVLGSNKLLEQVRANGNLVSLKGYKVHVLGASTRNLTPQAWNTLKDFWTEYFRAAGAELVSYSANVEGR